MLLAISGWRRRMRAVGTVPLIAVTLVARAAKSVMDMYGNVNGKIKDDNAV